MAGSGVSRMSTTETSSPWLQRASTASIPISPPPMMTARFIFPPSMADLMERASGMFHNVRTLGRSAPGMGGRMGDAPVAMTSLS
ncbi:MAG: hypothetical protein XE12_1585 [Synergistales bacterium 54_9]|nr:MAG: hypothetical protein XE12_1585 [Synergistales bacterium 54_9]